MRNLGFLGGILWILDGILGVVLVLFVFLYLIFPSDPGYLRGFDPEEPRGSRPPERPAPPTGDEVLKRLRNPLEKPAAGGPAPSGAPAFRASLLGVLPSENPRGGAAFLRLPSRNLELFAFPDEKILYEGKPVEELAGWTLAEVYKDRAVFTNGAQRQVVELEKDSRRAGPGGRPPLVGGGPPAGAPAASLAGQPYQPDGFKSRVLASSESQQVWAMDPQEIEWAFQNQERILDQDFQVTPVPGGGLRIESVQPGSIGASRGLMPGDVVKSVNGIPLNSLADVRNLTQNPTLRRQPSLRLVVERAGRPMVLTYQPLRP